MHRREGTQENIFCTKVFCARSMRSGRELRPDHEDLVGDVVHAGARRCAVLDVSIAGEWVDIRWTEHGVNGIKRQMKFYEQQCPYDHCTCDPGKNDEDRSQAPTGIGRRALRGQPWTYIGHESRAWLPTIQLTHPKEWIPGGRLLRRTRTSMQAKLYSSPWSGPRASLVGCPSSFGKFHLLTGAVPEGRFCA